MFEQLRILGICGQQGIDVTGIVGVELLLNDGFCGAGGCGGGSVHRMNGRRLRM